MCVSVCISRYTHTHTHNSQRRRSQLACAGSSPSPSRWCPCVRLPRRRPGVCHILPCVCVCVCVHGQTQTHRHRHRHRHRHKHRHRHRHRHTDTDTDTHPHTLHTTYTCLACRSYPVPDNTGSIIGLPHTSRKRFKEGLSKTREASTTPWSGGILTGYLCSGTCWCVLGFITANVTLMKLPAFRRM